MPHLFYGSVLGVVFFVLNHLLQSLRHALVQFLEKVIRDRFLNELKSFPKLIFIFNCLWVPFQLVLDICPNTFGKVEVGRIDGSKQNSDFSCLKNSMTLCMVCACALSC